MDIFYANNLHIKGIVICKANNKRVSLVEKREYDTDKSLYDR